MLEPESIIKTLVALIAVLLPILVVARMLRSGTVPNRPGRRLAVQEVVALDTRRRLVVVRCDGRDLLLLTGGSQDAMLGWLPEGTGQ